MDLALNDLQRLIMLLNPSKQTNKQIYKQTNKQTICVRCLCKSLVRALVFEKQLDRFLYSCSSRNEIDREHTEKKTMDSVEKDSLLTVIIAK